MEGLDLNTGSSEVLVSRIQFFMNMARFGYIDFSATPAQIKQQIEFSERTLAFFLKDDSSNFTHKEFLRAMPPTLLVVAFFIYFGNSLYLTPELFNSHDMATIIAAGTTGVTAVHYMTKKKKSEKGVLSAGIEVETTNFLNDMGKINSNTKVLLLPDGTDMLGFDKINVADVFRDATIQGTSATVLDFESAAQQEEVQFEQQDEASAVKRNRK